MTLELQICTIDEGIYKLRDALSAIQPRPDVHYLVSWQHTTPEAPPVPAWLEERSDVEVITLAGRGLCRNRNHALRHALHRSLPDSSELIVKISDDDERWTPAHFDAILDTYRRHPEYDIVHFQAQGKQKTYPPRFVSSWELTLRLSRLGALRFDERFGLGSPQLNAGEETVLLHDAVRQGLSVHYVPRPICEVRGASTGDDIRNPLLARSKGAVLGRTHSLPVALWLSLHESLGWMVRRGENPIRFLHNMWWGIKYIRQPKEQREPSSLLVWPSRDGGRRSQPNEQREPSRTRPGYAESRMREAKPMPTVTIVIPILNREAYLSSLFRSLSQIAYEGLEVILVDNGSSDGSLALCRTFASDATLAVRVLEEPRRGACIARNRGLRDCRTEWIYFFDSDDCLTPTFLCDIMPQVADESLVSFPAMQVVGGKVVRRAFVAHATAADQLLSATLNTGGMLFRTDFLRDIGGWNETLDIWQDWELGIRALLARPRVLWLRRAYHKYILHPDSITGTSYAERRASIRHTLAVVAAETDEASVQRALLLRCHIVNGQLRRQGAQPLPVVGRAGTFTRCLGCLLEFYTRIGGRGAWRLARLLG